MMRNYYIESFEVTQLWGYQNINLPFNSDVNILIGPNRSGKTTVLHFLYSILLVNLQNILDIKLISLVPIVWLPVSRRLPEKEDEEER